MYKYHGIIQLYSTVCSMFDLNRNTVSSAHACFHLCDPDQDESLGNSCLVPVVRDRFE